MADAKSLKKEVTLQEDEIHQTDYRNFDAIILSPALGCPAIIQKAEDGDDVWLEMILLTWSDDDKVQGELTSSDVAFHLRFCLWDKKNQTNAYYNRLKLFDKIVMKTDPVEPIESLIKISPKYKTQNDIFATGLDCEDDFTLKLANTNVFAPVLEKFRSFPYLYKVSINLKYEEIKCDDSSTVGLYNIRWVDRQAYETTKGKPSWWCSDSLVQDVLSGRYRQELKDYGKNVIDTPLDKMTDENIRAYIYHPVYVSNKQQLDVGHVTDIHMDSRMDLYAQSEASVIEVKCNCAPTHNGKERTVKEGRFHSPIKEKIANFNEIFTDVCKGLFREGADLLILTGDLVDYNRGIHTEQTHKKKFSPIAEVWEALKSDVSKDDYYKTDRNWLTFYDRLIELYDSTRKPIFTLLGNHDYVNYGMAPWPTKAKVIQPWNGVFDQNLTLYESALCFGPGYNSFKAFRKDLDEQLEYVEWYMFFINPLADFVLQYGDQSIFMVDWGVKSSVIPPSAKSIVLPALTLNHYEGVGTLHHAKNVFSKKEKNHAIYNSWIKTSPSIKMLFMHATAICPRDDISIGEIDYDLSWKDNPLKYGSFDGERERVLNDLESGTLSVIVGGHSHRNVIMKVDKGRAEVIGSGSTFGTIETVPEKLALVTSSCGPLPKYIPGGPLICGCTGDNQRYETGWDFRDGKLYEYKNIDKDGNISHLTTRHEVEETGCTACGMSAKKMVRKQARRHRPGGNLLAFDKKLVKIKSVFSGEASSEPRPGVICDEQEVFTGTMKLEHIENEKDFKDWKKKDPITIMSRTSFVKYGYMEIPNQVEYVTYLNSALGGYNRVYEEKDEEKIGENRVRVRQMIEKDLFKYFMWAAIDDADFAFASYMFGTKKRQRWDREIKMYREFVGSISLNKSRLPITNKKDPFKNLVIKFLRKPDLEKRRRICGY